MCIEKHVLVKKMFTNELNMGLPPQAWVEKTVYVVVETHWFSCKEKVLGSAESKEGHTDSLLEDEKTHCYWYHRTENNASYCRLLKQYLGVSSWRQWLKWWTAKS